MMKSKIISKGVRTYRTQGSKSFAKKSLLFVGRKTIAITHKLLPSYLRKRIDIKNEELGFVSNAIFQIDTHDLVASKKATKGKSLNTIKTANWFVPYFEHLSFGGIYTIFRFISYLSTQGVNNRVIIYDNPTIDGSSLLAKIQKNFPAMNRVELIIFNPELDKLGDLPESDIALCTFWVSAYFLLKFNKTKRKYYFIQDYEPLFYPGGSTFALAESTYRFGFKGIVNTPGLLKAVNQRHGLEGVSFVPAVDTNIYYPDINKDQNKRIRIFFYSRPNSPRNAFNLGVQIIEQLMRKYGDKIEIVTAGAEWEKKQYKLHGHIDNKGLIRTIPEVAELYRQCDIGFVYMLSKHPSYQPFEFMASGVATVTNNNEDNLWLLKHEENCLISEPSPKAMVEQISRLIDDRQLRDRIKKNGLDTISMDWDKEIRKTWEKLFKMG